VAQDGSLQAILAPYPSEFQRITNGPGFPLGEYLPSLGRVFRIFNPREPNYYDQLVDEFIRSTGGEPSTFNRYEVVPKRVDLSVKALMRYNRMSHPFSEKVSRLYENAGHWLDLEFGPYLMGSLLSSYDQVIEWLQPKKSPGYPWTLRYPFKCDYYGSPNGEFYAKYWDVLSTPDYIRSLCSVTIKEEVRPKEKIDNGEVRTIVAMDTNHIIASCQLCLDQNNSLIKTVGKHSISLGLNMMGGGFHHLNERMSPWGPERGTIELDGKKFDGRFRYHCMKQIQGFRYRMLRREFQTPENWAKLSNLYRELAHSPLVNVDGWVYGRACGNPSGQGNTTPDNSFKNFMDIVVLWHLCVPVEYHTYAKFHELLRLCICGDDINITVHESVRQWFNIEAIKAKMAEIDMEYHFASDDFRPNHECSFLGHSYKLCDIPSLGHAMYLPVIDCERMRSNMLIDNEQQTVANTIVRACGLRNETFACESCRDWFAALLEFLRDRYGASVDPAIVQAWTGFKTDRELWQLFTGMEVVDVRGVSPQGDVSVTANNLFSSPPCCPIARVFSDSLMCECGGCFSCVSRVSENSKTSAKMPKSAAAKKRYRKKVAARKAGKPAKKYVPKKSPHVGPKRRMQKKAGPLMRSGAFTKSGAKAQSTNIARAFALRGARRVSDGLSSATVVHNGGRIEHRFPPHREKLVNVFGSSPFVVDGYVINPGNTTLFPWFSTIAANYEEWRCEMCVFSYESESYTASGSAVSAGKMLLATNYNVSPVSLNANLFGTDVEMENYINSERGVPYSEIWHDALGGDHRLKSDPLKNYFVNYGANTLAATGDTTKFYDLGVFQIATQGNNVGSNPAPELGELYVTYQFTMIRPRQIPSSDAVLLQAMHAAETPDASATPAQLFGSSATGPIITTNAYIPSQQLNSTVGNSTGTSNSLAFSAAAAGGPTNNIVFPGIGYYLVTGTWFTANNNIASVPGVAYGNNIVGPAFLNDGGQATVSSFQANVASIASVVSVLTAGPIGIGLTAAKVALNALSFSMSPGMTAGECDLFVCQLPNFLSSVPILMNSPEGAFVRRAFGRVKMHGDTDTRLRFLEDRISRLLLTAEESGDECDVALRKRKVNPPVSSSSSCLQSPVVGLSVRSKLAALRE